MICFKCKNVVACASYFGVDTPVSEKDVQFICNIMGGFAPKERK